MTPRPVSISARPLLTVHPVVDELQTIACCMAGPPRQTDSPYVKNPTSPRKPQSCWPQGESIDLYLPKPHVRWKADPSSPRRILRSVKGAKPNVTGFDMKKLTAAAGQPKYDPWENKSVPPPLYSPDIDYTQFLPHQVAVPLRCGGAVVSFVPRSRLGTQS